MKRKTIFFGRMAAAVAALSVLGLNSCHSTLYNAAARGDVETVKHELAAGVNPNKSASQANLLWQIPAGILGVAIDAVQIGAAIGTAGVYIAIVGDENGKMRSLSAAVFNFASQKPVEVAYENGHTAVVEELSKAGVGVSPTSVAGKQIVMQWDYEATNEDAAQSTDEWSGDMNSFKFDKFWSSSTPLKWNKTSNSTTLAWNDSNKKVEREESENYSEDSSHEYKKTGADKAFINSKYVQCTLTRVRANYDAYELIFTTPTSGTCRRVGDGNFCDACVRERSSGRFWLKDESKPAVTSSAGAKRTAKKKRVGKKKAYKKRR